MEEMMIKKWNISQTFIQLTIIYHFFIQDAILVLSCLLVDKNFFLSVPCCTSSLHHLLHEVLVACVEVDGAGGVHPCHITCIVSSRQLDTTHCIP